MDRPSFSAHGNTDPRAQGVANPLAFGATPALAQWFAAKAEHPDALIFFRMGDFYEMFFTDAEVGAEALSIAVSFRGEHQGQPVPMAGVPQHSHEAYLARLIRRGFRVAICDQTETPEQAKARKAPIIDRRVVRVVTPGTVTEDSLLEAARPAWLLALVPGGAAWLDITSGIFETEAEPEITALMARLEPTEVIATEGLWPDATSAIPPRDPGARVAAAFGVASLEGFGSFAPAEVAAAAMALEYVRGTQNGALPHLMRPAPRGAAGVLAMDASTRRSLELLRAERGDTRSTLLHAVDRTLTGAGARELAARLAAPLADLAAITARHDAVAHLQADPELRGRLRSALKGAPDMARALARLSLDRFTPRDLAAVRDGLLRAEAMGAALAGRLPVLLAPDALRPVASPAAELALALAEALPARIEDGGVVAPGYDGQLDALRRLRDDARGAIAAMQMQLAQAWGVAALKIRHHQQMGYLAELPAAAGEKLLRDPPKLAGELAPQHRQTMSSTLRFTCGALAELDRKLSQAADQAAARERTIAQHLRGLCTQAGAEITAAARAMAALDIHAAAAELGWTRPEMTDTCDFSIIQGRHPVVEDALRRAKGPAFVPNDADLSAGQRLCLLTGPNMAGKSTYLRQNALMLVLAQAGLFVPAESARIGVADRLFSRVGASDDLAGGRSTFMVEMTETAAILNQAGPRSFVILDEVGRGTATWDGLAIAWAVLEALHDRLRCRTLFATHFHELTALAGKLPELRLKTMRVREWKGQVVFLHAVGPGAAERSWGVHVARLAGLPRPVLARAEAVLAALEDRARQGGGALSDELPLFTTRRAEPCHPVLEALAGVEPDKLSPRDAQEVLYRLRSLLDGSRAN